MLHGAIIGIGKIAQTAHLPAFRKESLPVLDTSNKSYYVSLYVSLIDEFLQRVHRRQGSAQWIDEAYQSIAVLHACYLSAESKRAICLGSDVWKDDFNSSFLDWPPSKACVRYRS